MATSRSEALTCVLVGADTLLIECGEALLAAGHTIVAVGAGSDRVADWARRNALRVIGTSQPTSDWIDELERLTFDWLLAITHWPFCLSGR